MSSSNIELREDRCARKRKIRQPQQSLFQRREAASERALWAFFDCKKRWSLSWRGRLFLVFALLLVGTLIFRGIYPFLAITHRVDAEVLVVGLGSWLCHQGRCRRVQDQPLPASILNRWPCYSGNGGYVNDFQKQPRLVLGSNDSKQMVFPANHYKWFPRDVIDRDRTYGAAVALRDWFSAARYRSAT